MLKLIPTAALDAITTGVKIGDPLFLHGAPGVGKTSLVHEAGAAVGRDVLVTRLADHEPVDLYGMPFVANGKLSLHRYGWFPKEGDAPSIWFFDEWLQGTTAVQNAAGQLLNERRLGDYVLPDNVYICAASNRAGDRAGTNRMPSHIADRFTHLEVIPDVSAWTKWALRHDMPTELIAFIRFRPELLSQFAPADMTSPSPRSWEKVGNVLKAAPSKATMLALIAGRVGEGAAAEVMGFLELFAQLPNPDTVLMNPDKAIVPPLDQPATLYAICGAIARKATVANMDRVVKYANRLPEEFNVVLVKQAVDRDPKLSETRPFIQWASDHEEAMN